MSSDLSPSEYTQLLERYLGANAGRAVAAGGLARGRSFDKTAAILLADIRGSTPLIRALATQDYIGLLNDVFDVIVPEVTSRGGEVLQFTGDGVLAVFEETDEACRQKIVCPIAVENAFAAAVAADEDLRAMPGAPPVGFGLSYGLVAYGNVGTDDRMTFTVISAEVSRADRLQRLCPLEGNHIAMSEAFAGALDEGRAVPVGVQCLKGFDDETEIFVPAR